MLFKLGLGVGIFFTMVAMLFLFEVLDLNGGFRDRD